MYERGKPAKKRVRYPRGFLVANMVLDLGFVNDLWEQNVRRCWLDGVGIGRTLFFGRRTLKTRTVTT